MIFYPQIIWEKWVDQFGDDTDEARWTDYNNDLNHYQSEDDSDIDDEDQDKSGIKIPEKPIKVIASPLGLIPYNEYTASGKIFNFWLGHTNFNISTLVKNTIEKAEGVEILDIFTRYRFRVAVGKCFEDSIVMNYISKNVYKLYEISTDT